MKRILLSLIIILSISVSLGQTNIILDETTSGDTYTGCNFNISGTLSYQDTFYVTICPDLGSNLQYTVTYFDFQDVNYMFILDSKTPFLPPSGITNYGDLNYIFNGTSDNATLSATYYAGGPLANDGSQGLDDGEGCLTFLVVGNEPSAILPDEFSISVDCDAACDNITAEIDTENMSHTFNVDSIDVCTDENITFAANAFYTADNSAGTFNYNWDFGDGHTASGAIQNYSFDESGIYFVDMYADESGSCASNTVRKLIRVSSGDGISFSNVSTPDSICIQDTVSIDATGTAEGERIIKEIPNPSSGTLYMPGEVISVTKSIDYRDVFHPDSVVDKLSDITRIIAEIEHSYMGYLSIYVECESLSQGIYLHNQGNTPVVFDWLNAANANFGNVLTLPDGTNLIGEDNVGDGVMYSWYTTNDVNQPGLKTVFEAGLDGDIIDPYLYPSGVTEMLEDSNFYSEQSFAGLFGCPLGDVWTVRFNMLSAESQVDGFLFNFTMDFDSALYDLVTEYQPEIDSLVWSCEDGMDIVSQNGQGLASVSPDAGQDYNCTLRAYDDAGCFRDTTIILKGSDCFVCNPPTVIPGTFRACDKGIGLADFDLQGTEGIVYPGGFANPLTIKWYQDAALTVEITTPASYESADDTVYAVVGDDGCTSTAEIILNVTTLTPANVTASKCAFDGVNASFDLNVLAEDVKNGDAALTVAWFTDTSLNTEITSNLNNYVTASDTLIAEVSNASGCDAYSEVILTVGPVEANDTSITVCVGSNGDSANYDLTSVEVFVNTTPSLYSFIWFTDAAMTDTIQDPTEYKATDGDSVYVQVVDDSCMNSAGVSLHLINAPFVIDGSYQVCEVNGVLTYNLKLQNATIAPFDWQTTTIIWCEDEDCDVIITNDSAYVTDPTTVYAQVGEGCTSTSEVTLGVLNVEANPLTLTSCGDVNDHGSFDLRGSEGLINGDDDATFLWFEDITRADTITDAVYTGPAGTIYCEVSENECEALVAITLNVTEASANDAYLSVCATELGTFDLSELDITIGGGDPVTYYVDSNFILEAVPKNAFVTGNDTLWAVVGSDSCAAVANVYLSIDDLPTANPAGITLNEVFNGTATFDLTSVNSIVNGNTGLPVAYFINWTADPDDIDIQVGSSTIIAYTSPTTQLIAVVGSGDCIDTSLVSLNVIPDTSLDGVLTIPDTFVMIACVESGTATFDLTVWNDSMNRETGNVVYWYQDMALTLPILNPDNFQTTYDRRVYCQVNTFSGLGYVDLYAVLADQVGVPTNMQSCNKVGDGARFNLLLLNSVINRQSHYEVNWYEDVDKVTSITDPSDYVSIEEVVTVYAEVVLPDGACSEVVPVPVNLFTVDELIFPNGIMTLCGDGTTATFDLSLIEESITRGVDYTVTWYADSNRNTPIINHTSYVSVDNTVYASIGDGGCEGMAEVELAVGELAIRPKTIFSCSGDNTGEAIFNLVKNESYIMYGVEHSAQWYEDVTLTDWITNPFNYRSNTKSVWIDVTANGDSTCTRNAEVNLRVWDLRPDDTELTFCGDNVAAFRHDLRSLDNILNANTGLTVTWHETANKLSQISNPSNYIPETYNNGVATVYAEVCGNLAEVKLVVFEKDSFIIDIDDDEFVIDQGESVQFDTKSPQYFHDWNFGFTLSDSTISDPLATPESTTEYTVIVSNGAACSDTAMVKVFVRTEDEDYSEVIGGVFTPNDDGKNDVMYVKGPGICDIELRVFNRWGIEVFSSFDPERGWNGGYDNNPDNIVPPGDYRYTLRVKHCGDDNGWIEKDPGVIVLVR